MVRILGFLVGLGFVGVAAWSLLWGVIAFSHDGLPHTVEHEFHAEPRDISFSFAGPLGRFDRQQLQRGFQVFGEVCSSCHSLSLLSFRNLHDLGYTEAEVRAIAAQWRIQVPTINPQSGEATTRPAIPSDRFPSPHANEIARSLANNPPDLSLITKARHGGPAYIASLLTGYADAATYRNDEGRALPAENRPGQGLHFNPYFANLNIAMPPPITADNQVSYADGTAATREQMATDVAAFLHWAAEPNLQQRHQMGWVVLIFLIIATGLAYLSYQNVWATAKRKVRAIGPLDPENMARSQDAKDDAGIAG
jgi:ubiquinol-cytochrome c reductase cytochrome c1 subunit